MTNQTALQKKYVSPIAHYHHMLKTMVLTASFVMIGSTPLIPAYSNAQTTDQPPRTTLAASIALAGSLGGKALVVINNEAPRTMAVGQEYQGIKLLSLQGERATFLVPTSDQGTRQVTLRIGQTPIHLASSQGGATPVVQEIILPAGRGGHYFTTGYINDRQFNFMVDTGASYISMGYADAERLGIDYKSGRPVQMSTANGVISAYNVQLRSVIIQGVEILDVTANVSEGYIDKPYLLLGNSFLNHFDIQRTRERLILRRRL